MSLQTWKEGPAAGRTRLIAVDLRRIAVQRVEPAAAERGEGQAHRRVVRAACETEEPLASCLAQVHDHVVVDVCEAVAAARERVMRAAQRDEAAVGGMKLVVPGLGPVPRHRAPRVLAPLAFEAELVAGEDRRNARARHLEADPDELPLAGARDRAEARAVMAVEDQPRVEQELPRDTGAERPHRRRRRLRAESRQADRQLEVLELHVAAQPRPDGPRKAGVVHDAVPAAEIRAEVVEVLRDENRVVPEHLAEGRRHLGIDVGVAGAAAHVRDVDAPAVELVGRLQPL